MDLSFCIIYFVYDNNYVSRIKTNTLKENVEFGILFTIYWCQFMVCKFYNVMTKILPVGVNTCIYMCISNFVKVTCINHDTELIKISKYKYMYTVTQYMFKDQDEIHIFYVSLYKTVQCVLFDI